MDFAGPVEGKYILIIVDAHSKWIEATCTASTSSSAVIEVLRPLFARFGLPESVVTDNGTGFVSQEFEEFLRSNRIVHTTSAPYHPASNGLAERAVQTLKRGLKKVTGGTMTCRLAKVLMAYRITPQTTTGVSPAELLLGRRPRTRLDLLKPNTAERVEKRQQEQKSDHDKRARSRTFSIGDHDWVKNFGAGDRWLPGEIVGSSGQVNFQVRLENGRQRSVIKTISECELWRMVGRTCPQWQWMWTFRLLPTERSLPKVCYPLLQELVSHHCLSCSRRRITHPPLHRCQSRRSLPRHRASQRRQLGQLFVVTHVAQGSLERYSPLELLNIFCVCMCPLRREECSGCTELCIIIYSDRSIIV